MIIIPFIVTPTVLPRSSATGQRALPTKMAPLFAAKSPELQKITDTTPRANNFTHNECLWMTVGVPTIDRLKRRYAAQRTREWRIQRRMNPRDAPQYAPFVIIFAVIGAISVPYGA